MTLNGLQTVAHAVDNRHAFTFLNHSPLTFQAQPPAVNVKPCSNNNNNADGIVPPGSYSSVLSSLRGGGVEPHQNNKKDSKKRRRRKRGDDNEKKDEEQRPTMEEKSKENTSKQKESATPTKDSSSTTTTPPPPPIVKEILQEDDYYKILGITKQEADPVKVKKAYRRRAVLTHPDKTGGDRRAFDKVAEAYEVLSDDNKRQLYDRFGKAGLDASSGFAGAGGSASARTMNAEDLFRSFFGGGPNPFFPQQQQQQPRRNRTVRYQLEVSLEELYNGTTRTVLVSAPSHDRFRSHQQQPASKRVQVHIPKGSFSNQSVRLSGEMDFDANETPGDIVFLLRERPHAQFTRKGYDLAMSLTIPLQEAICGVRQTIRHLDGRKIVIASAGTEEGVPFIIQNGTVQVLRGQGMPKDATGKDFGDLYIQFQVQMPQTGGGKLTEEERAELGRLLDKLEGNKRPDQQQHKQESDVKKLQQASIVEFGHASGEPTIPHDEHEEDEQEENGFFSSPFGTRRFFYSSGGLGTNPFFGATPGGYPGFDNDEENVQCRQM